MAYLTLFLAQANKGTMRIKKKNYNFYKRTMRSERWQRQLFLLPLLHFHPQCQVFGGVSTTPIWGTPNVPLKAPQLHKRGGSIIIIRARTMSQQCVNLNYMRFGFELQEDSVAILNSLLNSKASRNKTLRPHKRRKSINNSPVK